MKTPILQLLLVFLFVTSPARAADNTLGKGLGIGEHFPYKLAVWNGKEHVITKLKKTDELYEFVRVSKEEFQVRQAGGGSEVYFKFNTAFHDGGAIWLNGRLIDILKTKEKVSALLYGDSGYFLIEASKMTPQLKKGQIYIIPKLIRSQHWNRTFLARSRDYYQSIDDVRYPLSGKVASARILDSRKIEFVYKDSGGKIGSPDIFHFDGDTLFKNGKEHERKVIVTDCISDEKSWGSGLESALRDKEQRSKLLKYYDKDDLLAAFSNASDPQIHKKLIALVEELYAPAKK